MKGPKNRTSIKLVSNSCVFCGFDNCFEAIDHEKLTLKQLNILVNRSKLTNKQLDFAKQQIKTFFQQLQQNIVKMITKEKLTALKWLNQFYFTHMDINKINLDVICSAIENDYQTFPSKKLIKIVKQLKSSTHSDQINMTFEDVRQSISIFLKQFNVQQYTNKFTDQLFYKKVIDSSIPFSFPKRQVSQIENPQQPGNIETIFYKNVKITANSKQIELSSKKITDNEFIQIIPVLSCYKNVRQFQIRHNKITDLSCRLIASNMEHIKSLDIRNNKITDDGAVSIVKKMHGLKSLMISQTLITDKTGYEIAEHLPHLELLWSEHTKLGSKCCVKIAHKANLRVLSLAGNQIDPETADYLRKYFFPKGYLVI